MIDFTTLLLEIWLVSKPLLAHALNWLTAEQSFRLILRPRNCRHVKRRRVLSVAEMDPGGCGSATGIWNAPLVVQPI